MHEAGTDHGMTPKLGRQLDRSVLQWPKYWSFPGEAALRTVEVHRKAFREAGLEAAFARAIGMVVQPGVEGVSQQAR